MLGAVINILVHIEMYVFEYSKQCHKTVFQHKI